MTTVEDYCKYKYSKSPNDSNHVIAAIKDGLSFVAYTDSHESVKNVRSLGEHLTGPEYELLKDMYTMEMIGSECVKRQNKENCDNEMPLEVYIGNPKIFGTLGCDGYEAYTAAIDPGDIMAKDSKEYVGIYKLAKIVFVKNETVIGD